MQSPKNVPKSWFIFGMRRILRPGVTNPGKERSRRRMEVKSRQKLRKRGYGRLEWKIVNKECESLYYKRVCTDGSKNSATYGKLSLL